MATKKATLDLGKFFQTLKESQDYRDFLFRYLEGKSLSLASFARATGYGRGFPGDIISGKRRLSALSSVQFESALKLPRPGRKLFRLLVAREEKDLFPEIDRSRIPQEIDYLRSSAWELQRRDLKEYSHTDLKKILADSRAMSVFSATGLPTVGATQETIAKRTGFNNKELEQNLESLLAVKLLKKIDDRYFSNDVHINLETHEQSELLISLFQKGCRVASDRVAKVPSGPEMFFASNFCIREKDLPLLKKELKETILKFVDNSLTPEGDRIVKLLAALHF